MKALALLVAALLTACTGASTVPGEPAYRVFTGNLARDRGVPVPAGVWGGDHLQMTVTETEASLEFDCAHGTIYGPLLVDMAGQFAADGVYVAERGGPIHGQEPADSHRAEFRGRFDGNLLTLVIILVDGTKPPATYSLTKDGPTSILKCR